MIVDISNLRSGDIVTVEAEVVYQDVDERKQIGARFDGGSTVFIGASQVVAARMKFRQGDRVRLSEGDGSVKCTVIAVSSDGEWLVVQGEAPRPAVVFSSEVTRLPSLPHGWTEREGGCALIVPDEFQASAMTREHCALFAEADHVERENGEVLKSRDSDRRAADADPID